MPAPITGGCLCRAIRFRLDGPPLAARACWCRDCQYLSSGNASIGAIFASSGLHLDGRPAEYRSTADSGAAMRRRFCPACGTPLFAEDLGRPDVVMVRAGALDDPSLARPQAAIWTASAPGWARIDPGLPSCAGQP